MPCANAYCPRSGESGSARITSTCLRTRLAARRRADRRALGQCSRGGARERATKHGHRLHQLTLDGLQRVQPCCQQRAQARRHIQLTHFPDRTRRPSLSASAPRSASARIVSIAYNGTPAPARRSARALRRQPVHEPVEQRSRSQRRRAARAAASSRRAVPPATPPTRGEVRSRERENEDRSCVDQSNSCSMKSNSPSSAQCRSSNTKTTGSCAARRSKNNRQPREQLRADPIPARRHPKAPPTAAT